MHERPITLPEGTFDAILFDCDGTLVESAPAWHLAICHALEGHSADMPQDWYYDRLGLSPAALMDVYEQEIGPLNIPRQEFFHRCVTGYRDVAHALAEVTVVANVAREWQGKVPMAVVTNAQRPAVEGALAATGLRPLFQDVISVEDVVHGKPAPDIYLKAAERLGMEPHRCLVLEDSHEGLLAAHRAGMRAIDIRHHWTPVWKR